MKRYPIPLGKPLRGIAAAVWIMGLIQAAVGLWTANLTASLTSQATEGQTGLVLRTGLTLLLVLAAYHGLRTLAGIQVEQRKAKALHQCRLLLYRQFLSCPLPALYAGENGQAKEMLNDDFETVTGKHTSLLPDFGVGLITTAAYFAVMAWLSLPMAAVLLGISLIQVLPPLIVKKFLQQNYQDTRDIEAELTDFTIESHRGFATIKLYQLKDWYLKRLAAIHKRYLKIGNGGIAAATTHTALNTFVSLILKYGGYGAIGLFVLYGQIPLEAGIQAVALSTGFFGAVNTAFSSITKFAVLSKAEGRLSQWFRGEEGRALARGEVSLENLSLSFGDRQLLNRAELTFPEAGVCRIKGPNGTGKSTLLKAAAGLIRPDSGRAAIGGADTTGLSDGNFPNTLYYLPQEDPEFSFTPRELYQMVLGEKIAPAAAQAEEFGLQEKHLQTNIDQLSGGERKKVYLSLAFALDPPYLLLDEPSNSLDSAGKACLAEKLRQRKGLTLLITHDEELGEIAAHTYALEKGGIGHEKN